MRHKTSAKLDVPDDEISSTEIMSYRKEHPVGPDGHKLGTINDPHTTR